MGLAGPKRRNKLSHDPNNTGWSNSTDSYGQKILLAQGWKPGDYLGARDASHAEHYTAANKAHIKTLLREDGLGLGAQIGKSNAETFGLTLYSGVLSRLNGKSDAEVEKQQSALRDAELRTYQANKYGFMNFVSGGVLVGDTTKQEKAQALDASTKSSTDPSQSSPKRRKLDNSAEEESDNHTVGSAADHQPATVSQHLNKGDSTAEVGSVEKGIKAREAKRKTKKKRKDSADNEQLSTDPELDKRILRQQKRARKEERRKRKEEKRKVKAEKDASPIEASQQQPSSDATRPDVGKSAVNGSRHAVRHRYIHQKRMASLDPQAMREIFMLKAGA